MFGQKNHVQDPHLTTQELLNYHKLANEGRIEDITAHIRQKRQGNLGSKQTYKQHLLPSTPRCLWNVAAFKRHSGCPSKFQIGDYAILVSIQSQSCPDTL